MLVFLFYEKGIRNLAKELKEVVEVHNDENRECENYDKKRRALNMDKLEEIYDHIVDAKRDGLENKCLDKVDVKDTKPYYRATSNIDGGKMTEKQKKA